MPTIESWSGGLSLVKDPQFLSDSEGVVYSNIDYMTGILKPFKGLSSAIVDGATKPFYWRSTYFEAPELSDRTPVAYQNRLLSIQGDTLKYSENFVDTVPPTLTWSTSGVEAPNPGVYDVIVPEATFVDVSIISGGGTFIPEEGETYSFRIVKDGVVYVKDVVFPDADGEAIYVAIFTPHSGEEFTVYSPDRSFVGTIVTGVVSEIHYGGYSPTDTPTFGSNSDTALSVYLPYSDATAYGYACNPVEVTGYTSFVHEDIVYSVGLRIVDGNNPNEYTTEMFIVDTSTGIEVSTIPLFTTPNPPDYFYIALHSIQITVLSDTYILCLSDRTYFGYTGAPHSNITLVRKEGHSLTHVDSIQDSISMIMRSMYRAGFIYFIGVLGSGTVIGVAEAGNLAGGIYWSSSTDGGYNDYWALGLLTKLTWLTEATESYFVFHSLTNTGHLYKFRVDNAVSTSNTLDAPIYVADLTAFANPIGVPSSGRIADATEGGVLYIPREDKVAAYVLETGELVEGMEFDYTGFPVTMAVNKSYAWLFSTEYVPPDPGNSGYIQPDWYKYADSFYYIDDNGYLLGTEIEQVTPAGCSGTSYVWKAKSFSTKLDLDLSSSSEVQTAVDFPDSLNGVYTYFATHVDEETGSESTLFELGTVTVDHAHVLVYAHSDYITHFYRNSEAVPLKGLIGVREGSSPPVGCTEYQTAESAPNLIQVVDSQPVAGCVPQNEDGAILSSVSYVEVHLGRVFLASGTKLWFAKYSDFQSVPITNWIDVHEPIVALVSINSGLAVLCHSSIYLLTGTEENSYAIKLIESSRGCIDARTVAKYKGTAVFVSDDGLHAVSNYDSVPLTAFKLERIDTTSSTTNAVVIDDIYYLLLSSGYIMYYDFRVQVLGHITIDDVSDIVFTGDELALLVDGAIKLFDADESTYCGEVDFKSGTLAENMVYRKKEHDRFILVYKGTLTFTAWLDGIEVVTKSMSSEQETTAEIRLGTSKNRGRKLQYQITGECEVYSIYFDSKGIGNVP